MDDVWFGPGLTRRDYDRFLQALSLSDKGRPPLLAVLSEHEGLRLAAASRALFRLFGARSARDLSDRLLKGDDPGARRLAALAGVMPLDGAPRLERLRFFVGPGTEIITFLCRRVPLDDGKPVFLAAALGVRAGLIPTLDPQPVVLDDEQASPLDGGVAGEEPLPLASAAMTVQEIQATLRNRWPSKRTVRFLWQSDADAVCTIVTPPLTATVGEANADIVGRNLIEIAPKIDPSGRLAKALEGRETWAGLDVFWPVSDASAAVRVGLGAIPAFDRDRNFDGFRGYGVIHVDEVVPREPTLIAPDATDGQRSEPHNVVQFPGGPKTLSLEDQMAFNELGAELRDRAGLDEIETPPQAESLAVADRPDGMSKAGVDASLPIGTANPEGGSAPPASEPLAAAAKPTGLEAKPAGLEAKPSLTSPVETETDTRAAAIGRHGHAIFDRVPVGLLVSRSDVPIYANRFLLDLLGFANEDALHDVGGMGHLFGGVPENASGSETIGIRTKDGTIIPAQVRMQTIEWNGLPSTLLTLQPATERTARSEPAAPTHAENAPADSDEIRELRAILETATDGVAVLDGDCNILSLNRSGEALFGCDRGSVLGKPFLELFAPENQDLAKDYLEGLRSSATKSLLNDGRELLVKAHRGGTIPVFMTLGRLDTADESDSSIKPRFCALFRDLTHWKQVERDLESAKQDAERTSALKTDFLAKVSHEIRTPLNAIIGFAEVIMQERLGPVGNERYKDYLRDIHTSGTHVMSLVNDLLDLSKIEAGKLELDIADVDVNKIVNEGVALMQPQASRERIIMRLSLAPGLPQIRADERSLRQIVLNILSNAVKFNEAGGQVIVATGRTDANQVVIRIRDTGPGMSPEDVAAALEPFRQVTTARQVQGGTGLGLPLTKALAEANNASFSIRSQVDHGTLVEIAFPSARALAS